MAIITKPQTIVKNQNNSFTLIKDDILDLTLNDVSIFTGSKFADSTTWKTVRLKYRSLTTKEYEVVEFNAQQVSPSGIFFVSEDADNDFKVVNITIANFDNATFVINRDLLDSCEINNVPVNVESIFDVTFDAPTVGTPIVWDNNLKGATVNPLNGAVSNGGNWIIKSTSAKVINGEDYKVTYTFTGNSIGVPSGIVDTIHGIHITDAVSDNDFTGFTGITYQGSSLTRIVVYYNFAGSPYGPERSTSLLNEGQNTIVIEKVGTVFTLSLNGTILINELNHTNQVMVPMVRPFFPSQVLDSAYIE
jgi:hypothetical protein